MRATALITSTLQRLSLKKFVEIAIIKQLILIVLKSNDPVMIIIKENIILTNISKI
jgi:hypothetical protein